LIETVREKTLVLIDEPEAHLHPPLLSAFIRTLSDLLVEKNGVAIIATHSPVILQEVPKNCVWKIFRSGKVSHCERPQIETFGENVGVLTREVFGLEVSKTGYRELIKDKLHETKDYESVLELFSNQLGTEAKMILRSLSENRERGHEHQ